MRDVFTKLLLDTNVWLDYFLDRGESHGRTKELLAEAFVREDVVLYAASTTLKDVFYLIPLQLKRSLRAEGIAITESLSAAAIETAWSCLRVMLDVSQVVPIGKSEALQSIVYRSIHEDFEDNFIASAVRRADADYLVTSDERFCRHSLVATVSVQEAIRLLEATRPKHSL